MPKSLLQESLVPDSWLMDSKVSGIRYLPASQRVARPWKNGGGVTYDVASFPETANLNTFQWRVSIAEVAGDGPFSIFSGIDRSMAILQGDGLELEIDGVGSLLLRMNEEPRSFPADVATDARLLSGPILDLNAMSRRGCFNHSLQRIDVTDDYTIKTRHHALLVWCAGTGKIGCNMGTIAAKRYDAFLAQEPVTWQIRADANGQVLLMEFMAAA